MGDSIPLFLIAFLQRAFQHETDGVGRYGEKQGRARRGQSAVGEVERRARAVAEEMNLELVEVTLQKESRGKCLCVYVDKEGGLSLDDCERYHKRLQPMLEDVDYDIMEVSSPGADRPVKTRRDFEKHRGGAGGGKALCCARRRKGVSWTADRHGRRHRDHHRRDGAARWCSSGGRWRWSSPSSSWMRMILPTSSLTP